jgi:hypothetical protein
MTRQALILAEVSGDPQALGYDEYLPDSPGHVVRLINEPSRQMIKSRIVSARAILAECAGGAAIWDKLLAIAAQNSTVKLATVFLQQEAGIDVGSAATQAMITLLTGPGMLTQAEGTALKNLALQPCSRAEQLGLGVVTEQDLRDAGAI